MHVSHKKAIRLPPAAGRVNLCGGGLKKRCPGRACPDGRAGPRRARRASEGCPHPGLPWRTGGRSCPGLTATLHDKDPDVRLEAVKRLERHQDVRRGRPRPGRFAQDAGSRRGQRGGRAGISKPSWKPSAASGPWQAAVPALTGMAKDANRNIRESAVEPCKKSPRRSPPRLERVNCAARQRASGGVTTCEGRGAVFFQQCPEKTQIKVEHG